MFVSFSSTCSKMIQYNKRRILFKTAYNVDNYLVSLSEMNLSIAVKVAVNFLSLIYRVPSVGD